MTPTDIRTALASAAQQTQERILLRQLHAHITSYLATHDPYWLQAALDRCDAGERRGGASAETFRRARAKVQLYEATGRTRMLESVLELTKGDKHD